MAATHEEILRRLEVSLQAGDLDLELRLLKDGDGDFNLAGDRDRERDDLSAGTGSTDLDGVREAVLDLVLDLSTKIGDLRGRGDRFFRTSGLRWGQGCAGTRLPSALENKSRSIC